MARGTAAGSSKLSCAATAFTLHMKDLQNSCVTAIYLNAKHHEQDLLPSNQPRRKLGALCTASEVLWHTAEPLPTVPSPWGAIPATSALFPIRIPAPRQSHTASCCCSSPHPHLPTTRKGCGRGDGIQFKVMLASCLNIHFKFCLKQSALSYQDSLLIYNKKHHANGIERYLRHSAYIFF